LPLLYVTEPGAVIRRAGGSLVVTLDSEADGDPATPPGTRTTLLEVEPHRLEGIVAFGRVHVTREALFLCVEQGIAVAWTTAGGKAIARVVPPDARMADLALAQYRAHEEPARHLSLARGIVQAKILNAAEVLEDIQSNVPGDARLSDAIAGLKVGAVRASAAETAESLLGIEGTGARTYFGAWGAGLRPPFAFLGRRRRPPPDPVNALLSLGYVLLGQRIEGALHARGLDPGIGFFHELRPGRPSLALDLLEELRHPLVDRCVQRACNLQVLSPSDFEDDPEDTGGVRLTRPGLKAFLEAWEKTLAQPLRELGCEPIAADRLIQRQVDRIAADLRGGNSYRPFRYGD